MMYDELITALQNCATKIRNCEDGCAYKDKGSLYCQSHLQLDAADAIEELQKNHTYCSDMLKLALRVTGFSMSALVQIYQIEQKEKREKDENK